MFSNYLEECHESFSGSMNFLRKDLFQKTVILGQRFLDLLNKQQNGCEAEARRAIRHES